MKLLGAFVVGMLLLVAVPVLAMDSESSDFPTYTGPEMVDIFDYAVQNTLRNIEILPERPHIMNNTALDDRIWDIASARGYKMRPIANGTLTRVGFVNVQPDLAAGWATLEAESRQAGTGLTVFSGHRSLGDQRLLFRRNLSGTSDQAIIANLRWRAIPGASKHHSGYAVDFKYRLQDYAVFKGSPAQVWLAKDNYEVAKRHGFLPSYPEDAPGQGPEPESWEYVWVGRHLIECGIPQNLGTTVVGPAAGLLADIARCPSGTEPPTIPDWMR